MLVIGVADQQVFVEDKRLALRARADALLPLALGEEHVVSRFPDDDER